MRQTSPILTTSRLQLRPVRPEDTAVLHQFWALPEVRKYLWDDEIIPYSTAAEVVASSQHDFVAHGFGHWGASFRGGEELIGWCSLRQFDEPPKVEVLYGIRPEYWGNGLAVEATLAVLQFGFEVLGLAQIYAGTDPPNAASLRVMEKVGMRFDQRRVIQDLEAIYYVMSQADFHLLRSSVLV